MQGKTISVMLAFWEVFMCVCESLQANVCMYVCMQCVEEFAFFKEKRQMQVNSFSRFAFELFLFRR